MERIVGRHHSVLKVDACNVRNVVVRYGKYRNRTAKIKNRTALQ